MEETNKSPNKLGELEGHDHSLSSTSSSSVAAAANQGVGESQLGGKPIKNEPLLIPCDFYEFQQMQWRSEIILDEFDQDNVPYSPNLHKMWLRHCQRLEKLNQPKDDQVSGQEPSQEATFPGFHYRPETGDVVYEDGSGVLSIAPGGTWILNDKDQLVSGPVPLSSMMAANKTTTNEHQSLLEDGSIKMRNRCYSDNQNGLDYSSSCKSSNDSGIDVEGEVGEQIATTPSQDEFKPPLNSTPQRIGGSGSGSAQLERKFQMLDIKQDDEDDEDEEIERTEVENNMESLESKKGMKKREENQVTRLL